jgi:hypothetical protein
VLVVRPDQLAEKVRQILRLREASQLRGVVEADVKKTSDAGVS